MKTPKTNRKDITHIEGVITITAKGIGYVTPSNTDTLPRDIAGQDIEIDPAFLNTALNGDRVRITLHPIQKGSRATGEVTDIIERAKTRFAGILEGGKKFFFLVPQDPKMYVDIFIPRPVKGARNGAKALVELVKWNDPKKNPEGKIIKVLGKPGDNNVEMEAIVLDKGLATDFPQQVKKEARNIYQNAQKHIAHEAKKRRDFRRITTFTIDPKTAKDFDDALSIRTLPDGSIEVGIHIADVSAYVKPDTALDREAAQRGTSIYLVDRTIPMLPPELSDDICSLKPNEERLAFSAVFTFSPQSTQKNGTLRITKEWFGETVISSDKRFAYEEAQTVLDNKSGQYFEELNTLNTIAYKLRKEKFAAGAIAFESEEVSFVLDKNGKPIDVVRKERTDTHLLIEDFMLLANKKIAEYAAQKAKERKAHFVYRIHPDPEPEKIAEFIALLKTLGYTVKLSDGKKLSSKAINTILEKAKGTPEEALINTMAIRSLAKAVYSTKNTGHFGLAFKYYTHFTSPIRRYPDIMVHRTIKSFLKGERIPKEILETYEEAARHSSQMEQAAEKAERESVKYKQVEYMSERIGKIFDGTISGITSWGIYVEENHSRSEGMVRISEMNDDYYIFDEKTGTLVGKNTKKKYRIGDKVKIKVKSTDLEKRTIDYIFA